MATTQPASALAPDADTHPAAFNEVRIGDTLFIDDGRILKVHDLGLPEHDTLTCAELLLPLNTDPCTYLTRREYEQHTVLARPEYLVVYRENGLRWAQWATRATLDGHLGSYLADKVAAGGITDLEVHLGDRRRSEHGWTNVTYAFALLA